MTRIIIIILLASSVQKARSQDRYETDPERLADELFSQQDTDISYEELYENLVTVFANPLDLNSATTEELRFLHLLSEYQIQKFEDYRKENGELLSIYELQTIPGFDSITLHKLEPYIMVNDPSNLLNTSLLKRIVKEKNNYLITRFSRTLEKQEGYKASNYDSRFTGSSDNVYIRFRTSHPGDFSFGFTMEKDAGEPLAWNPSKKQYGFDYVSFHAQVLNKGKLKNVIAGDFQGQFGQGLMLGGVFGMGKGGETVTTVRRSNIGFVPYTSAYEAGGLRGGAVTIEISKNIYFNGFYSNIGRDALIAGDSAESTSISSFSITGLHRTPREQTQKKTIREISYGTVINFKHRQLDAGLMLTSTDFGAKVERAASPYNQYAFANRKNHNVGAFINYSLYNFTFFGEVSKTLNHGLGFVGGFLGSLGPQLDIAFLYRRYDRNFYTFYSNGFAEGTMPQNESGLYWGWKYRWNRRINITGYADLFRFPWLRFRIYKPSDGHEWLIRLNYQPSKNVKLFAQFREESKIRNVSNNEANLYKTTSGTKHNITTHFDYGISKKLGMKTRIQFSTFESEERKTSGMTVMQDIVLNLGRIKISARHALFDTENYDNRQYAYERDVWLAYSLPAYNGTGIRNYAMVEYDITKKICVWVRYSRTRYTDREEIGSGPETIHGNIRRDLKFQLRIKF
jgi:hypothetical protein